jgi:hypothetical protein
MSLSKLSSLLAFLFVFTTLFTGCGSDPANTNADTKVPVDPLATSEFPFSTKEPDAYQGEFYAGGDDYQNKWFVARNGDKWRIDFYTDGQKDRSQIKTDHVYYIDHKRKIFAIEPEAEKGTVQSSYFTTLLSGFFKDKQYRSFEDLGREGDLRKYRVKENSNSEDQLYLYVDEPNRMVVKQEFLAHNEVNGTASSVKYTYEIKNFKPEAPDDLFQLPAGYKSVEWKQFAPYAPAEAK